MCVNLLNKLNLSVYHEKKNENKTVKPFCYVLYYVKWHCSLSDRHRSLCKRLRIEGLKKVKAAISLFM